jgi:hypothetical protein
MLIKKKKKFLFFYKIKSMSPKSNQTERSRKMTELNRVVVKCVVATDK